MTVTGSYSVPTMRSSNSTSISASSPRKSSSRDVGFFAETTWGTFRESRLSGLGPGEEMLLPTALDSLLPCRNFLLQLFKPVQHDVDLRRCRLLLLGGLEHQEALAIGRHIVVGE